MIRPIAICVSGLLLIGLAGAALAQPASLPDAGDLYARIRERYRPMYEKYQGVEDRSRVETWRYDSKSNELKQSQQFIAAKRNFFYKKAQQRILKTIKGGVETDASDDDWSDAGEPMIPIWDADGPRHYAVQVTGRDAYRGQACYVLEVEPRKKSKRHFAGTVRVNVDTLDLVMMEGGMADIPLGAISIRFTAVFRQQGDVSLYDTFELEAFGHVPVIYPNVKFVWRSRVLESWPIPK